MMQINIEVIAVEVINKGKYKVAEVTSKQDGKTGTKKVMSFGAQEQTFKVFAADGIKKGDCFAVEIEKNADGYWDWISAVPTGAANAAAEPSAAPSKSNPAPARGNYETPEERTNRQDLIVRQACLNYSLTYLNHNKKNYEPIQAVDLAESFVLWVNRKGNFATADQPINTTEDVPM